jgi:hypothetical protein
MVVTWERAGMKAIPFRGPRLVDMHLQTCGPVFYGPTHWYRSAKGAAPEVPEGQVHRELTGNQVWLGRQVVEALTMLQVVAVVARPFPTLGLAALAAAVGLAEQQLRGSIRRRPPKAQMATMVNRRLRPDWLERQIQHPGLLVARVYLARIHRLAGC